MLLVSTCNGGLILPTIWIMAFSIAFYWAVLLSHYFWQQQVGANPAFSSWSGVLVGDYIWTVQWWSTPSLPPFLLRWWWAFSLSNLGPLHTRLRARSHCTSSNLIGGKGGAGPSSLLHTTLEGPWSMWMQDGCKVHMDFYMASNGSCFMVT